jgi:hypothetical protein
MDAAGRWITLRYAGTCARCGRALGRGQSAWHERAMRTVTCVRCRELTVVPTQPPAPGRAGASALREYQRRRQRREDRARRRFGVLGVAATRLSGDPHHVAAWKRGADGEAWVAERLAKLTADRSVVLLHDRRLAGARANIDHLAIGPGGVTVIDAKNLTGTVRVERRGRLLRARTTRLLVAGRDRTSLVSGVERLVAVVRSALDERGFAEVDVRGALCLINADGLPLLSSLVIGRVAIDGPRPIARKVVCRPGSLGGDRGPVDRARARGGLPGRVTASEPTTGHAAQSRRSLRADRVAAPAVNSYGRGSSSSCAGAALVSRGLSTRPEPNTPGRTEP